MFTEIKHLKNSLGSYVLNPNDPNALAGVDNVFGVRVITNTHVPVGTALVFDTDIAVKAWTREGMEILSNQFGDYEFAHNAWTFRAEERVGIGVQYPHAICIVTGLGPTLGS